MRKNKYGSTLRVNDIKKKKLYQRSLIDNTETIFYHFKKKVKI